MGTEPWCELHQGDVNLRVVSKIMQDVAGLSRGKAREESDGGKWLCFLMCFIYSGFPWSLLLSLVAPE